MSPLAVLVKKEGKCDSVHSYSSYCIYVTVAYFTSFTPFVILHILTTPRLSSCPHVRALCLERDKIKLSICLPPYQFQLTMPFKKYSGGGGVGEARGEEEEEETRG